MCENIVRFPDHEQLQTEVDRLYDELVDLVVEEDELELVETARASDEYLLQFGALQYRCQHAEYQLHRLERKLQMMDGHPWLHDRSEMALLEHRLDREFQSELVRLEEQRSAVSDMLKRRSSAPADNIPTYDFRATYRKIVKRVHPDLHPLLTDYGQEHYACAREALRTGDFITTLLLEMMYSEIEVDDERFHSTSWLLQRRAYLQKRITSKRGMLEEMLDSPPLSYRGLLADEKLKTEHRTELETKLSSLEEQVNSLQQQITLLLSA